MATTYDDLKSAVRETLHARGVLDSVKARIRAEIFKALDDQEDRSAALSNENLIINELIREYFEYNGYKHSQSVFIAESSQPKEPMDREFLRSELHINDSINSSTLPLLYSVVFKKPFAERADRHIPGASVASERNKTAQMNALFLAETDPNLGTPEWNEAAHPTDRDPKPVVMQKK